MTLPRKYRKSPEGAVAVYDYNDIADGTGVVNLYGSVATDRVQDYYILSNKVLFSSQIEETTAFSVAGFNIWTDVVDKDFDLTPFNNTRSVYGTAYVRFSAYCTNASGIAGDYRFSITLKKWDGTTETDIASVTSAAQDLPTNPDQEQTFILPIDISSVATFTEGEQLRINVLGQVKSDGNPGTTIGELTFGTDPQNRDGSVIVPSGDSTGNKTTNLRVWIPFRIDID